MRFRALAGRTQLLVAAWVVAALAAVAWSPTQQAVQPGAWRDLVVLTVCAVGYDEVSRRLEAARRGLASGTHVSMRSAWAVVGLVALPIWMFGLFVSALYVHAGFTSARSGVSVPVHRHLFNASTMIASAAVAAAVVDLLAHGEPANALTADRAVLVLAAAVLTYFVVNSAGLAGVLAVSRGHALRGDLSSVSDNLLELGTLGIGALCALSGSTWVVAFALPVIYLLQRSALVDDLELAAQRDTKTQLLNAAAWHVAAGHDLQRHLAAGRTAHLLLIDIDHFKAVNDDYGHLAGDVVLAGIADTLTRCLRSHDLIGRFGGEEFVAFLPGLDAVAAVTTAERVRASIADHTYAARVTTHHGREVEVAIQATVSIGLACSTGRHTTLTQLLTRADAAMYQAKNRGRNCVVDAS